MKRDGIIKGKTNLCSASDSDMVECKRGVRWECGRREGGIGQDAAQGILGQRVVFRLC